ncbi:hypothetical protein M0R45_036021 [Rubus argutus]|uniref:NADH dehydrogenase subunit 6 n=1 Tax=Rubus argutus TaxID=59490 RepID=A0AAW1VUU2_RUBAR
MAATTTWVKNGGEDMAWIYTAAWEDGIAVVDGVLDNGDEHGLGFVVGIGYGLGFMVVAEVLVNWICARAGGFWR